MPRLFAAHFPTTQVARGAVGGLLVGLGAGLGNGCTSGHGICGNARLSVRSMVYTYVTLGAAGGGAWGWKGGLVKGGPLLRCML
jgi:uncharacterized membrane protein YedE/YeeE